MQNLVASLRSLLALALLLLPVQLWAADIVEFAGTYAGTAEVALDGEARGRDIRTKIVPDKTGFHLGWTSITYREDGTVDEKSYSVAFVPSERDNIYASAMKTNMFGKEVPLDPLKGEPFVWARLEGDTLSVFSLAIDTDGGYELQEYHRTLVDGGLDLLFRRVSRGVAQKEITAFLERQ